MLSEQSENKIKLNYNGRHKGAGGHFSVKSTAARTLEKHRHI